MNAAIRRQYWHALTAAALFAFTTAAPARSVLAGTTDEPPIGGPGVAMQVSDKPEPSGDTDEVRYPIFGVTFEYAALPGSFSSVEDAFHKIEAAYAAQGIQLHAAKAVDMDPMLMPTLALELNRWVRIAWQAGRSTGNRNELKLTGGLVTCRYPLPNAPVVSLLGGLGGGKYAFTFRQDYGDIVATDSPGGGYTTLDHVKFEGGGAYWTVAGGVSVRPDPKIAIEGLFQYLGTGDVSTTTDQAVPISLNLSGPVLGASLTVFF